MSSFKCKYCGTLCLDGPGGYVTGCCHFPDYRTEHPPRAPKSEAEVKRRYAEVYEQLRKYRSYQIE